MDREDVFDVWWGKGSAWQGWVKPPLFTSVDASTVDGTGDAEPPYRRGPYPWADVDVRWAPPASDAVVLVDLAGAASILTGLALMALGYRPIVAINTCSGDLEIIPMGEVTGALAEGARYPRAFPRDPSAPPAFLFDARRLSAKVPAPGVFDNRWIVYRSDLPSGELLRSRGFTRAIVLVEAEVADDLRYVLHPWQEQGIAILRAEVGRADLAPLTIDRGSWLRDLFGWPQHPPGLERFPDGAFGRVIPEPGPTHG